MTIELPVPMIRILPLDSNVPLINDLNGKKINYMVVSKKLDANVVDGRNVKIIIHDDKLSLKNNTVVLLTEREFNRYVLNKKTIGVKFYADDVLKVKNKKIYLVKNIDQINNLLCSLPSSM